LAAGASSFWPKYGFVGSIGLRCCILYVLWPIIGRARSRCPALSSIARPLLDLDVLAPLAIALTTERYVHCCVPTAHSLLSKQECKPRVPLAKATV
jgi:hypothetical protein